MDLGDNCIDTVHCQKGMRCIGGQYVDKLSQIRVGKLFFLTQPKCSIFYAVHGNTYIIFKI